MLRASHFVLANLLSTLLVDKAILVTSHLCLKSFTGFPCIAHKDLKLLAMVDQENGNVIISELQ